MDLDTDIHI